MVGSDGDVGPLTLIVRFFMRASPPYPLPDCLTRRLLFGSSEQIRGHSFGRLSLPTQVSSSLVLAVIMALLRDLLSHYGNKAVSLVFDIFLELCII